MTDKLIINGIDVSGCPYNGGDLCSMSRYAYCFCTNKPNCIYKRLKRKEQELKRVCKAFDIEYAIDEETNELYGRCNKLYKKEQECKELKQILTEIKEYCKNVIKDHYWGMRMMRFANEILQIISKCEVKND